MSSVAVPMPFATLQPVRDAGADGSPPDVLAAAAEEDELSLASFVQEQPLRERAVLGVDRSVQEHLPTSGTEDICCPDRLEVTVMRI
jgi:hypothetical protein